MIEIKVNGCSKDRELSRAIKDSAQFFIKKLMPRKKRLKITIQLIHGLLEKESILGDCIVEDFAVRNRHYEFTIRIDFTPENKHAMITTLAHEMSHVKQYSSGRLYHFNGSGNISIWEGTKFDSDIVPYDELPWEIDALANEKALMSIYSYK